MATIAADTRFKRGLESAIPTLADGEPGWATDTQTLYVGQGGVNYAIGGSGVSAPPNAQYWVSSPDSTLSAEVDISSLSDGLLKHAGGTPATAVAGTDYYAPSGTDVSLADGGTGASLSNPGADRICFGMTHWELSRGCLSRITWRLQGMLST